MNGLKKLMLLLLCFGFLALPFLHAQNTSTEKVYFFVVDMSKSMITGNLEDKVVTEIKDFIRNEVNLQDRVIILGFGDRVVYYWDDVVKNTQDVQRIYGEIDKWGFQHNWTHMSAAFDHLAKRLNEINVLLPDSPKYIYFFTDGKNDPPRDSGEQPEAFRQILQKHFNSDDLNQKNAYVYYITMGIKPPQEIADSAEEAGSFTIHEVPPGPAKIMPEVVQLTLKDNNLKLNRRHNEYIKLDFLVQAITRSANLVLSSEGQEKTVALEMGTEIFSVTFEPQNHEEGTYQSRVQISHTERNGNVIPTEFDYSYEVSVYEDVTLQLLENNLRVNTTREDNLALGFKTDYPGDMELVFSLDDAEQRIELKETESKSENDIRFEVLFPIEELMTGKHSSELKVVSADSTLRLQPGNFEINYELYVPNYLPWYIIGALLLLGLILFIIYRSMPSFKGKLILVQGDIERPVTLSGKWPKKIVDLFKGSGFPASVKVSPTSLKSRIKVTHSLKPSQLKSFTKNGMNIKLKTFVLKSGEWLEYGDKSIRYESN